KLAAEPGDQLDRDIAQLRSALAWEEAVGAASAVDSPDQDEIQRCTAAALSAWELVSEQAQGTSPMAHAAAIVLATRLGDRDVIADILARAQAAERSPWAAASLALRRARPPGPAPRLGDRAVIADILARAQAAERSPWAAASLALRRARLVHDDPARVDQILDEAAGLDDPRRTVMRMVAAARRNDVAD